MRRASNSTNTSSSSSTSSGGVARVLAHLAQLFGSSGVATNAYGVDPVFLRSSDLYEPGLVGQEGAFYNSSNPAEVPPATGIPFGYFHRPLQVRPPAAWYHTLGEPQCGGRSLPA
jgi:hypothetical protein